MRAYGPSGLGRHFALLACYRRHGRLSRPPTSRPPTAATRRRGFYEQRARASHLGLAPRWRGAVPENLLMRATGCNGTMDGSKPGFRLCLGCQAEARFT